MIASAPIITATATSIAKPRRRGPLPTPLPDVGSASVGTRAEGFTGSDSRAEPSAVPSQCRQPVRYDARPDRFAHGDHLPRLGDARQPADTVDVQLEAQLLGGDPGGDDRG